MEKLVECFAISVKCFFSLFAAVQAVPGETTRTIIGTGGNVTTTVTPSTAYIATHAPYPVQHGPYGQQSSVAPYPAPASYQAAPPYPHATSYAAAPYPTHGVGIPQPYQGVIPPPAAPYPVAPNPPPYDQVVSHEGYQKQAPFNPHYGGN